MQFASTCLRIHLTNAAEYHKVGQADRLLCRLSSSVAEAGRWITNVACYIDDLYDGYFYPRWCICIRDVPGTRYTESTRKLVVSIRYRVVEVSGTRKYSDTGRLMEFRVYTILLLTYLWLVNCVAFPLTSVMLFRVPESFWRPNLNFEYPESELIFF